MKIALLPVAISLIACSANPDKKVASSPVNPLVGTWKLVSATVIEKGDTAVTDYTSGVSFIKIINDTHFAFLKHDLNNGKDSTASYGSGGGRYSLTDSLYKEHLEYCSSRDWEGNDFEFTVTIKDDTLVQSGTEKVPAAGVDRMNIERYIRIKN